MLFLTVDLLPALLNTLTTLRKALVLALLLYAVAPLGVSAQSDLQQPTAAPGLPTCAELVVNGDFESAGAGWVSLPESYLFAYANEPVRSGRQSLQLGFSTPLGLQGSIGVEQVVALPANAESIELTFSYYTLSHGEQSPEDQAIVTVDEASIEQPVTTLVLPLDTGGVWQEERADLTALAGKQIRLTMALYDDGGTGGHILYVDDLSIQACAAAGIAVPTPTTLPPSTPTGAPIAPLVRAAPTAQPAAGTPAPPLSIQSLDACDCSGARYTCQDFSSWSLAQACFTACLVTVGFDVHNLDPDRNGIACELEIPDLVMTTSPVSGTLAATPTLTASSATTVAVAATGPTTAAAAVGAVLAPTTEMTTSTAIPGGATARAPLTANAPLTAPTSAVNLPAIAATPEPAGLVTAELLLGIGVGAGVLLSGGLIGYWLARAARTQPK